MHNETTLMDREETKTRTVYILFSHGSECQRMFV